MSGGKRIVCTRSDASTAMRHTATNRGSSAALRLK
jgi:hypothetical protein